MAICLCKIYITLYDPSRSGAETFKLLLGYINGNHVTGIVFKSAFHYNYLKILAYNLAYRKTILIQTEDRTLG